MRPALLLRTKELTLLPTIFISYRRDDAPGSAGRLSDALRQRFGSDNVFMDVDTLQPGDDFVDAIEARLTECDVMLAVIGRHWLDSKDDEGRLRLADEGDYLRIEVQTALGRGVRTIPVLVERATMPRLQDLPEPIRSLARRQAAELREARWQDDIADLIEKLVAKDAKSAAPRETANTTGGKSQTDGPTSQISSGTGAGITSDSAPPTVEEPERASTPTGSSRRATVGTSLLPKLAALVVGVVVFVSIQVWLTNSRASALRDRLQTDCDRGDTASCRQLGKMYRDADGVVQDTPRAAALIRKACEGGSMISCADLGAMSEYGMGVSKNEVLAASLFRKACDAGESYGCYRLAEMYASGREFMTSDPSQALSLYRKACELGDKNSCEAADRLLKFGVQ